MQIVFGVNDACLVRTLSGVFRSKTWPKQKENRFSSASLPTLAKTVRPGPFSRTPFKFGFRVLNPRRPVLPMNTWWAKGLVYVPMTDITKRPFVSERAKRFGSKPLVLYKQWVGIYLLTKLNHKYTIFFSRKFNVLSIYQTMKERFVQQKQSLTIAGNIVRKELIIVYNLEANLRKI